MGNAEMGRKKRPKRVGGNQAKGTEKELVETFV
jgi:hypothetical protein